MVKRTAAALKLPQATTYRLLNLLVGEEYLVRLPDLHGFALGRKVAGLTGGSGRVPLSTAAREVVADLRQHVRAGIHLVLYTATTLRLLAFIADDLKSQAPRLEAAA